MIVIAGLLVGAALGVVASLHATRAVATWCRPAGPWRIPLSVRARARWDCTRIVLGLPVPRHRVRRPAPATHTTRPAEEASAS